MSNNAFYIVEEFLRSHEPQARRNALSALALMEDEKSVGRLCAVALGDEDEGVRRRAADEIVSLPDGPLSYAIGVLRDGLQDEAQSQRAYAVLGRLQSLGKRSPGRLELSLLARLRRAWAMNIYLEPTRNYPYRVRAWQPALIGATFFAVLLSPFFGIQAEWAQADYIGYPFLMILLSVLTCIFATQRATPINLYLDRKAAFLVETAAVFIFSLLISALLFLVALLDFFSGEDTQWFSLIFGVPVVAAATRAATLFSFGVVRGRRTNLAFQVCVAFATVFLLLAAFNFFIWQINPRVMTPPVVYQGRYEPDDAVPEAVRAVNTRILYGEVVSQYRAVQSMWVFLLPLAGAAAFVFASVDKKSPPVGPVAGRAGVAFSVAAVGLSAALLGATLAVGRGRTGAVNLNSTFEGLKRLAASGAEKKNGRAAPPQASPSP